MTSAILEFEIAILLTFPTELELKLLVLLLNFADENFRVVLGGGGQGLGLRGRLKQLHVRQLPRALLKVLVPVLGTARRPTSVLHDGDGDG